MFDLNINLKLLTCVSMILCIALPPWHHRLSSVSAAPAQACGAWARGRRAGGSVYPRAPVWHLSLASPSTLRGTHTLHSNSAAQPSFATAARSEIEHHMAPLISARRWRRRPARARGITAAGSFFKGRKRKLWFNGICGLVCRLGLQYSPSAV